MITNPPTSVPEPVYWRYTVVSDDEGEVSRLTCDPPSGWAFDMGVTSVTCTAVDEHKAETTCQFHVYVHGRKDNF